MYLQVIYHRYKINEKNVFASFFLNFEINVEKSNFYSLSRNLTADTMHVVSFNRKHKCFGHLFQNRYKSILCHNSSSGLTSYFNRDGNFYIDWYLYRLLFIINKADRYSNFFFLFFWFYD